MLAVALSPENEDDTYLVMSASISYFFPSVTMLHSDFPAPYALDSAFSTCHSCLHISVNTVL